MLSSGLCRASAGQNKAAFWWLGQLRRNIANIQGLHSARYHSQLCSLRGSQVSKVSINSEAVDQLNASQRGRHSLVMHETECAKRSHFICVMTQTWRPARSGFEHLPLTTERQSRQRKCADFPQVVAGFLLRTQDRPSRCWSHVYLAL